MSYLENEWNRIINKIKQQLIDRQTIGAKLDFKNPWILIATWFGSGVFLPASGTWGTIATLPFAIPIWYFSGYAGLAAFLIIVFILGMKAADIFEKQTNTHDSGLIVVDEVIGFTICLFFIPFDATWIALAFLLFRGFDTIKPWPISWVDMHTKGAWGVIADDIAAGVATGLTLLVLQYAGLLAEKVKRALEQKNLMLVTAESCTGGMIGAAITDISGSSKIYDREFITYSNEAKMELIGVPAQILIEHGAVSCYTAKAMAQGALQASPKSNISVSVTGIAGPDGGTKDKPLGLVYIAVAQRGQDTLVYHHNFTGGREAVRQQTVEAAFTHILEVLA